MTLDISYLQTLEEEYGTGFASALRSFLSADPSASTLRPVWKVSDAKDHLSQVLELVRGGQCQVIMRPYRGEAPVLLFGLDQLAQFVKSASTRSRFADLIRPDASLPVADTPLDAVDDEADSFGEEHFEL